MTTRTRKSSFHYVRLFLCLNILSFAFHTTSAQGELKQKKQAFILGTFHFASNQDVVKNKMEDMMTEKRQKEIEDLVASISTFNPDKICIEWEPDLRQHFVDSAYNEYLKGNFKLRPNEVYQIAFRLAKKLGHKRVYCVDGPGDFMYDTLLKTAKKYNQDKWLDNHIKQITKVAKGGDSVRKLEPLKASYRKMNSPSGVLFGLEGNFVFDAPLLGVPGEYGGAEFLGEWYKRNLRIYSNIVRTCEANDKKIFVLIGAGHKGLLKQFFDADPSWEVINIDRYLK